MNYLNNERLNAVIAMPVETMALLSDGNDIIDKEFCDLNNLITYCKDCHYQIHGYNL